ncbi:MAG: hypothetical protein WD847_04560 [Pirellulales bacterium]
MTDGLAPEPAATALLGLVFSGGGLVGLWAGSACLPVPVRLVGLVAGLLYLGCLLGVRSVSEGHAEPDDMPFYFLLVAFSACPAFFGGIVLRRFGPKLRITLVDRERRKEARIQITVRFLFGLTAAIALFLTALRVFGQLNYIPMVLGIGLGSTAWLAAAAVLVPRRPLLPALAAIGISSLAGFIPTHFLAWPIQFLRWWIAVAISQAVITVAFLFVVRWSGYRLAPSKLPPGMNRPAESQAVEQSNPAAGFRPSSAANLKS